MRDMELEEIKKLLQKKLSEEEKIKLLGHTAGSIICILAKHLINSSGYGVISTILMREVKNLGKKDAEKIMKIFDIKRNDKESASTILKILAYNLGLELKRESGETIVTKCPYGESVRETGVPFICSICVEYNKGVVEAVLGPDFTIEKTKYLLTDNMCSFNIKRK
jgi:hypothetical protein